MKILENRALTYLESLGEKEQESQRLSSPLVKKKNHCSAKTESRSGTRRSEWTWSKLSYKSPVRADVVTWSLRQDQATGLLRGQRRRRLREQPRCSSSGSAVSFRADQLCLPENTHIQSLQRCACSQVCSDQWTSGTEGFWACWSTCCT